MVIRPTCFPGGADCLGDESGGDIHGGSECSDCATTNHGHGDEHRRCRIINHIHGWCSRKTSHDVQQSAVEHGDCFQTVYHYGRCTECHLFGRNHVVVHAADRSHLGHVEQRSDHVPGGAQCGDHDSDVCRDCDEQRRNSDSSLVYTRCRYTTNAFRSDKRDWSTHYRHDISQPNIRGRPTKHQNRDDRMDSIAFDVPDRCFRPINH